MAMLICDLCGAGMSAGAVREIEPAEMRVIAGNGYGKHVSHWIDVPPADREQRLFQLALINDTPWGLCPACHERTRPYAVDTDEGMSHEVFRQEFLMPLLRASGALGDEPRAPEPDVQPTVERSTAERSRDSTAATEPQAPRTGGCFLATAACGSESADDVVRLRAFRESVLRPTLIGRAFIGVYETVSPPLARLVARSPLARSLVRTLLIRPARRLADRALLRRPGRGGEK